MLVKWPDLSNKLGDFRLEASTGEILGGQVLGVVGGNATGKTTSVKMSNLRDALPRQILHSRTNNSRYAPLLP